MRAAQAISVKLLQDVGCESALLDTQLLLGHVLTINRIDVQLQGARILTKKEWVRYCSLLARRLCGEPVAYLLGQKEFYGLEFMVSEDCLIPRPDTEVVVEKCLSLLAPLSADIVFDLCTGSGAIGITLLSLRPQLKLVASDISPKALAIAQKNAASLGVFERFIARQGDLFAAFKPHEQAQLIVANPPYIPSAFIGSLARDVRDYEPRLALDGGVNEGVDFYRRIIEEAPSFLRPYGYLVLEIGFDQEQAIRKLVGSDITLVEFFCDLAGNTRGVVLQKHP